jgi:hypothetical protein
VTDDASGNYSVIVVAVGLLEKYLVSVYETDLAM